MNITPAGEHVVPQSLEPQSHIDLKDKIASSKSEVLEASSSDYSVSISIEAIELLNSEVSTMGNGNGNEPLKDEGSSTDESITELQGNGNGNEPSKVKDMSTDDGGADQEGNGNGNEPPA